MDVTKIITKIKKYSSLLIPLVGLTLVLIVFSILSNGLLVSEKNINNIINQATITAIVATGAVFLFSLGMLDISLGAICCISAILAAFASKAVGGSIIVLILVCITVSVILSVINGAVIGITKLPSFIVTLVMMNILSALSFLILGKQTEVKVPFSLIGHLDTSEIKLITMAIVFISALLIFNFTKLGRQNKVIGANATNAKLSGINYFKNTLISYLICGVAVGIGSFLLIIRTGTISPSTGSAIGFDVIVSVVLGGMAISGGMKSKITAGIIGAFTITILNNGMTIIGTSIGMVQLVRGVIFLAIVTLLAMKNRTKYLV